MSQNIALNSNSYFKGRITRDAYFKTKAIPSRGDIAQFLTALSNETLEDLVFQLSVDIESISGQIFRAKAERSASASDSDTFNLESVKSMKLVQLACTEREASGRSNKKHSGCKTFVSFHRTAKELLDPVTFARIEKIASL